MKNLMRYFSGCAFVVLCASAYSQGIIDGGFELSAHQQQTFNRIGDNPALMDTCEQVLDPDPAQSDMCCKVTARHYPDGAWVHAAGGPKMTIHDVTTNEIYVTYKVWVDPGVNTGNLHFAVDLNADGVHQIAPGPYGPGGLSELRNEGTPSANNPDYPRGEWVSVRRRVQAIPLAQGETRTLDLAFHFTAETADAEDAEGAIYYIDDVEVENGDAFIANGDVEGGAWPVLHASGGILPGGTELDINTAALSTEQAHSATHSMKITATTAPSAALKIGGAGLTLGNISDGETQDLELYCYLPQSLPANTSAWVIFFIDQNDDGDVNPGGSQGDGSETDAAAAWSTSLADAPVGEWFSVRADSMVIDDTSGDGTATIGAMLMTFNPAGPADIDIYFDDMAFAPPVVPARSKHWMLY
jgi:hypothetical protein